MILDSDTASATIIWTVGLALMIDTELTWRNRPRGNLPRLSAFERRFLAYRGLLVVACMLAGWLAIR